jgi:septal ring-binding cell division protein DamX
MRRPTYRTRRPLSPEEVKKIKIGIAAACLLIAAILIIRAMLGGEPGVDRAAARHAAEIEIQLREAAADPAPQAEPAPAEPVGRAPRAPQ